MSCGPTGPSRRCPTSRPSRPCSRRATPMGRERTDEDEPSPRARPAPPVEACTRYHGRLLGRRGVPPGRGRRPPRLHGPPPPAALARRDLAADLPGGRQPRQRPRRGVAAPARPPPGPGRDRRAAGRLREGLAREPLARGLRRVLGEDPGARRPGDRPASCPPSRPPARWSGPPAEVVLLDAMRSYFHTSSRPSAASRRSRWRARPRTGRPLAERAGAFAEFGLGWWLEVAAADPRAVRPGLAGGRGSRRSGGRSTSSTTRAAAR